MYKIGIDVGGTHTDGVLLDWQGKSHAWGKTTTTASLEAGVKTIVKQLLTKAHLSPCSIQNVIVGTTHATNAILEGKNLLKVGLLRLLDGKPRFPSPGFGWPLNLKEQVIAAYETCEGGYECDGRSSTKFNLAQIKQALMYLMDKGVEAISVVGSFSPLNGQQEKEVGFVIQELAGKNFPFSLSHQIGGIGLIERENATLLNSALKKVIAQGFCHVEEVLRQLGIEASLWLTQNNGSLLSLQEAIDFPIKTIGAGPTNSFVGATRLCGAQEAIVVDIGGTSTDIGIVEGGYARSSLQAAAIGGIPLHFSMPDMISLAFGGGSHVQLKDHHTFQVGPQSVARELKVQSRVFGGSTLTLTDVGIAAGYLQLEDSFQEKIGLNSSYAKEMITYVCQKIYQGIIRLRGKRHEFPVILVGGGASLLQPLFKDFGLKGWAPIEASVANAYGAGLAEVSSVIDGVFSLKEREKVLNDLKEQAKQQAIAKGANPKQIRIANISILPFAYTSDALAKVVITASGPHRNLMENI